ncbi:MAG: FtsX-like permease family protein, partial [Bacteroidales bacterium]|nr:FtsX-like permease family protein [Bacteroidales bacterium]
GSREAIVAEDLARYLRIGVGDTLVLISQGYHGVTAAGLFRISGIISHPSPELNRVLVYLDISAGREFFSTGERSTSLIVMIDDNDRLEEVRKQLEEMLGPEFEVMTWKEIEPILIQQIESDRASGRIMKAILYVLIAFGILGTIMMMMAERRKEMGVLIAVGMQRHRLSLVLLAETFLIGLIGVAAGILASIPINYYFFMNPIPLTGQAAEMALDMGFDPVMKFSTAPFVYLNQAVTVFILTVLISVYPLVTVMKLRVMSALRA